MATENVGFYGNRKLTDVTYSTSAPLRRRIDESTAYFGKPLQQRPCCLELWCYVAQQQDDRFFII